MNQSLFCLLLSHPANSFFCCELRGICCILEYLLQKNKLPLSKFTSIVILFFLQKRYISFKVLVYLYFSLKRLARTNMSKPMLTKTKIFKRTPILKWKKFRKHYRIFLLTTSKKKYCTFYCTFEPLHHETNIRGGGETPFTSSSNLECMLKGYLFIRKATFSANMKWQLSNLFIKVQCTWSVCFRVHCAWAAVFTRGGHWTGTVSAIVQEHWWKVGLSTLKLSFQSASAANPLNCGQSAIENSITLLFFQMLFKNCTFLQMLSVIRENLSYMTTVKVWKWR